MLFDVCVASAIEAACIVLMLGIALLVYILCRTGFFRTQPQYETVCIINN